MTVKELKDIIAGLPDNMQIFMDERKTEFHYGLVNSAEVKEITFSEDEEGLTASATETVLALSEE